MKKETTGQHAQHFEKRITVTVKIRYLLYLPQDYSPTAEKKWPVMLFLHGAGERGHNLSLVKKHGPPAIVKKRQDFPFIVVSPQCPSGETWSLDVLDALLSDVEEKYLVDSERIYVTGLSMGGFAAWALAIKFPRRFAALAPVCGGGKAAEVCTIKHLPVWVFHGAKDNVVPLRKSQEMVDALKQCGGKVRFTIYPDAGHDSWTTTYNNPDLYEWMLRHKRRTTAKK